MSIISPAVSDYLLTRGEITALIDDRIYPNNLPQNATLPAIVLRQIASDHHHHLDESLKAGTGIYDPRLRVDCYGTGRLQSNQLGDLVRQAVQGFYGDMGGTYIHSCQIDGFSEDTDHPRDGSDRWRYLTMITLQISAEELIP